MKRRDRVNTIQGIVQGKLDSKRAKLKRAGYSEKQADRVISKEISKMPIRLQSYFTLRPSN